MESTSPGEPIGRVIARLRAEFPDLTASSLHFLEREGLLAPGRSGGGHRLFTPADVERIRQIKRWQSQRLSIAEIRERLRAQTQLPDFPELVDACRDALLAGDTERAMALLRSAQEGGRSFLDLCERVLRPVLVEIGHLWVTGDVSVAEEHEASAAAREALTQLATAAPRRPPAARTALTACVAGERHELGLRMIACGLELLGWRVHYLGADVPTDSLLAAIAQRRPDLVIVSVTLAVNLPEAIAVCERVRALPDAVRPRLLLGGQALIQERAIQGWPVAVSPGGLGEVLDWVARTFPDQPPIQSSSEIPSSDDPDAVPNG